MERPFLAYKGEAPYIFVSYAHADAPMVYPELARLRDGGFNVWYDEGISPGATWRDEVALAVSACRILLYFVTPQSVASTNCQQELNFALSQDKKILCIHLEKTEFTLGMELSLSDKQAILRSELSEADYWARLSESLGKVLEPADPASAIAPTPSPHVQQDHGPSIAVLPLANRNLDAEIDYLAEGIAEELIRGLSKIEGLRVASQISTFGIDASMPLDDIGRRLKVANILSGSIQKSGDRLRVNVLLSTVDDGATLWTERYDGTLEDIFAFQDDVAAKVVDALKVELVGEEQATLELGTRNVQAYEALLMSRHAARKSTRGSFAQAALHAERAIALDPDFIEAYEALLVGVRAPVFLFNVPREVAVPKVEAMVPRLRQIDPQQTLPIWIGINGFLSDSQASLNWDPIAATQLRCEMILSPEHSENQREPALGYSFMSLTLGSVGLRRAAIAFAERFLELQTSSSEYYQYTAHETCAFSLTTLGDVRRAIGHLSQSLEENGDRFASLAWRAALYCRTGQYRLAEQDLESMSKTAPINHCVFCYHYWRGERETAIEYFDRLAARPNFAVWLKCWGNLMLADPQLGDTEHSAERLEKGLDYLEEGYEMRNTLLSWTRFTAPFWCPPAVIGQLEESERYQSFLTKVGLDDSVRDRVMQMVNEISDVTGIEVTLDEIS